MVLVTNTNGMKRLGFKKMFFVCIVLLTSCSLDLESEDVLGDWEEKSQNVKITFLKNNKFKGRVNGVFLSTFNTSEEKNISGTYKIITDIMVTSVPKIELNLLSINSKKTKRTIDLYYYDIGESPYLCNHEDSFLYCELVKVKNHNKSKN